MDIFILTVKSTFVYIYIGNEVKTVIHENKGGTQSMKRVSAVILASLMVASVQIPVCAEEAESKPLSAPKAGFSYVIPEKYRNAEGHIEFEGGGPLSLADPCVVYTAMSYYAVREDELDAYTEYLDAYEDAAQKGEEIPDPPKEEWSSFGEYGNVFSVYGLDGGKGEEELRAFLEKSGEPVENLSLCDEIGKEGDFTFYLVQFASDEAGEEANRTGMGDLYDEYCDLRADKETFLSGLTLSEPERVKPAEIGQTVSFSTTDLQGNTVSSDELFSGNKVNMINLWATWCGPCKREIPELAKMSGELKDKDCQLIGICLDAEKEGKAEEAISILADAGADYLNLVGTDEINSIFPSVSIPVTFYVDSSGRILTEPVVGAKIDEYPKRLEEALAAVS